MLKCQTPISYTPERLQHALKNKRAPMIASSMMASSMHIAYFFVVCGLIDWSINSKVLVSFSAINTTFAACHFSTENYGVPRLAIFCYHQ